MSCKIFEIADAVVALLAAGVDEEVFVRTFAPVRKRIFDLRAASSTLKVWVGGTGLAAQSGARDTTQKEHTIEIGVLQRVPRDELDAQTDELTQLVEQIGDYLNDNKIAVDGVTVDRVTTAPLYDHERLMRRGLFAGVVQVTYLWMRDEAPTDFRPRWGLVNGDDFGLINGDNLALGQ